MGTMKAYRGRVYFTIKCKPIKGIWLEWKNLFKPFCNNVWWNDETKELKFTCISTKEVDTVWEIMKELKAV